MDRKSSRSRFPRTNPSVTTVSVAILLRSAPLGLALLGAACGRATEAADARLRFVDVSAKAGIDAKVVCGDPRRWYIPESNGSGAALLDYDGDGRIDLFLGNGRTLRYLDGGKRLEEVAGPGTRLYRNRGDRAEGGFLFEDVTKAAGAA